MNFATNGIFSTSKAPRLPPSSATRLEISPSYRVRTHSTQQHDQKLRKDGCRTLENGYQRVGAGECGLSRVNLLGC